MKKPVSLIMFLLLSLFVKAQSTTISSNEVPASEIISTWSGYNDADNGGLSTYSLSTETPGANNTSKALKVTYSLDQGSNTNWPYIGFGFCTSKNCLTSINLASTTGISCYHKGAACYLLISIAANTGTNANYDYYRVAIPAHSTYTKVTYNWSDFAQIGWGATYTFNLSTVNKIQFEANGVTGDYGTISIDQVTIEGCGFLLSKSSCSVMNTANSSDSVTVATNATWTASSNQSWLTVSPSTSTTGSGLLKITAAENTNTATRTAIVTLSASGLTSKTITVTQLAGNVVTTSLSVSSTTASLAKESGSTSSIAVTSNTSWTATSDQTWLTPSPASSSGNGSITLTAASANTASASRTATVTVSAAGQSSKTITVTQAGTAANGMKEMTKYNINHFGCQISSVTAKWAMSTLMGEPVINGVFKWETDGADVSCLRYDDFIVLKCQSNIDPALSAWVSIAPTVPNAGAGYGYNTPGSPNWDNVFCDYDEFDNKTTCFSTTDAKTFWKNGFEIVDFKIMRSRKITVSTNAVNLSNANGSTFSADVNSSLIWTAKSSQTWLQVSPTSQTVGNSTITFTASVNTATIQRTATVTIALSDGTKQVITVTQAAGDVVVVSSLSVSSTTASLAKESGSSSSIAVTSNTSWTATSNQTWLTLSPAASSGNVSITLTAASANTASASRTATVTISAAGVPSKTITVTQAGSTTTSTPTEVNTYFETFSFDAEISSSQIVTCEISSCLDKNNVTHIAWIKDLGNDIRYLMYTKFNPITKTFTTTQINAGMNTELKIAPQIITDANNNPHIVYMIERDRSVGTYSGNYAVMYAGDDNGDGAFDVLQVSTNPTDPKTETKNIYNCYVNGRPSIMLKGSDIVVCYLSMQIPTSDFNKFEILARKNGTSWSYSQEFNYGDKNMLYGQIYINSDVSFPSIENDLNYSGGIDSYYFSPFSENPRIFSKINNVWTSTEIKSVHGSNSNVSIVRDNADKYHYMWYNSDSLMFFHTILNGAGTQDIEQYKIKNKGAGNLYPATVDLTNGTPVFYYDRIASDLNGIVLVDKNGSYREVELDSAFAVYGKNALHANNGYISLTTASESKKKIFVTTNTGKPWIYISNDSLTVSNYDGATSSATIKTNSSWIASSDQSWLTVKPDTQVISKSSYLVVNAKANPYAMERTANVSVTLFNGSTQIITVIQKAGIATLAVSSNSINVIKDANNTSSVEVTTNTSTWKATSNQTWLTVVVNGSTIGFTVSANPTTYSRYATVTVSATGASSKYITITQAAGPGTGETNTINTIASDISKAEPCIYPNPATSQFQVSNIEGSANLTVSNISGISLLNKTVVDNETISIQNFPKGIYFITIKTEKGTIEKKLVKE